jgi:hypothetical protein
MAERVGFVSLVPSRRHPTVGVRRAGRWLVLQTRAAIAHAEAISRARVAAIEVSAAGGSSHLPEPLGYADTLRRSRRQYANNLAEACHQPRRQREHVNAQWAATGCAVGYDGVLIVPCPTWNSTARATPLRCPRLDPFGVPPARRTASSGHGVLSNQWPTCACPVATAARLRSGHRRGHVAFNNIGPVVTLAPGEAVRWDYDFNLADAGAQFAAPDVKTGGGRLTAFNQAKRRTAKGGVIYSVDIRNDGRGAIRYNLQ